MALTTGQVPAANLSTSTVAPLVMMPAGSVRLLFSNPSGGAVLVGPGTAAGAPSAAALQAGGFYVANGGTFTVDGRPGSAATQLYIVGASGATFTASVTWMIAN